MLLSLISPTNGNFVVTPYDTASYMPSKLNKNLLKISSLGKARFIVCRNERLKFRQMHRFYILEL